MPINITEYKKTILEMFNTLTEIEIKASLDTYENNPSSFYRGFSDIYILAVNRCKKILETILEEKNNE